MLLQQLTQELKSGKMEISEVPLPASDPEKILVRNYYSIISAGTEGKTVKDARLGYIGKARSRQKEVKQVINLAKTQGIVSTYKMVMNKLEAPSPLGYSCAGEVIEVGEDINDIKVGDFVACGGSNAMHAELVSVPKNLCAKIPEGVDVKHAAFTTIAAIAIQGIRQADLRLGENCVVIGLGLIGQFTIQMLNAAGVQTYGIDIEPGPVKLALKSGATLALERSCEDLEQVIMKDTHGYGTDAVIITAGTSSLDPVELAGTLCRKKGKVVIVGAVPTGFSREHYYKKELELRMSSSYGPGRYDPRYEEKGIDYPIGYVRWTENRNMQAYLELLKTGKLNINALISHEFKFEEAPKAYQMIVEHTEPFTGIVLKYNIEKEIKSEPVKYQIPQVPVNDVNIGFIGAGSFAQNFLLPNVVRLGNMVGVATAHGHSAKNAASKYGFSYATGVADQIISDEKINTIFIATRHNLHATYILKGLKSGKNIFVEKPLALKQDELEKIKQTYHQIIKKQKSIPRLMVGYNRRFTPLVLKIKAIFFDDLPKAIHYRVNAGKLPAEHWVNDPEIGGGRIIGEICHFVDLCMFIAGSPIKTISAKAMDNSENLFDTISINIDFKNGSIATISYFSNGNKSVNKEYLEVFSGGQVVIIDDFREMIVYSKKKNKIKTKQNKGYSEEIKQFINSIKEGKPSPISFEELYLTSLATFKIIESINTSQTIKL